MEKKSVYQILRARYPEEECVLIQEVSDATGSDRSRSLDFMVVNLWASRGLHITGIELKSHRSDWLREIKNPKKQENHFQYCDYFYLLTENETVAKLDEIPETWGWMNIKGGKIFVMKKAPKLEAKPIPRTFLCSMLRRAATKEGFVHRTSIEDEIEKASERKKQNQDRSVTYQLEQYKSLQKYVEIFESASGIKLNSYFYGYSKNLGEAVNFVMNNNLNGYSGILSGMKSSADRLKDSVDKALAEFQLLTKKESNESSETE
jgi:hypothetical protein